MSQPFRLPPAMPVQAYKTYSFTSPKQTHTRRATCAEVECQHHLRGWVTRVDVSTELGQRQAKYIRDHAGRAHTVDRSGPDSIIAFTFPAGQECFTEHRVPLWREPIFVVRDGDWRGNPTGRKRRHANGTQWVEDFGEHQLRIKDQIEKG